MLRDGSIATPERIGLSDIVKGGFEELTSTRTAT
jgi:hypothetical protein